MSKTTYLAADIGGTNVRMGAYEGDHLLHSDTHSTKGGVPLLDLLHDFSETMEDRPEVIVVAAAGPVKDNAVQLTNAKQYICGSALQEATGARHARVINDFAAAAWASLDPRGNDLVTLQGTDTPPEGTRLVIGPGTGLGVGALARVGTHYASVPGEGGHVGLAPRNRADLEVFEAFRTLWPDVFYGNDLVMEAEGILSGTGLPILYRAAQQVLGSGDDSPEAGEIMRRAKAGEDPAAVRTIEIFKTYLGQVAGDLGLAFGAQAGVFLVGGVAMKNAWLFDQTFNDAFNAGGRFTAKREAMNLYLLNVENFGLQGAHTYAKHVLEEH